MENMNIIKRHKNAKELDNNIQVQFHSNEKIIAEHLIEEAENNYIFTAAIEIPKNGKITEKLIKEMIEKQTSPVINIFTKIEKENKKDLEHQENGIHELYIDPRGKS